MGIRVAAASQGGSLDPKYCVSLSILNVEPGPDDPQTILPHIAHHGARRSLYLDGVGITAAAAAVAGNTTAVTVTLQGTL